MDIDAAPFGDGLSWGTAFQTVQEGIDAAYAATTQSTPCAVWVAEGTYYVYKTNPGDTVQWRLPVGLFGGFQGTESNLEDRSPVAHRTVLDGRDGPAGSNRVEHVITAEPIAFTWSPVEGIVDGFTIREGNATGGSGGGASLTALGTVVFANCVFENNQAGDEGGAIVAIEAGLIAANVTFVDNTAAAGGAVSVLYRFASFVSCVFANNAATNRGGGINSVGSDIGVWNGSFAGNSAGIEGGAISVVFGSGDWEGGLGLYNSVAWSDEPDELYLYDELVESFVEVKFSLIQGGFTGYGNLDSDPLFVTPMIGDLRLGSGSPCIDASNGDAASASDRDGNMRVDDPTTPNTGTGTPPYTDMGAYEFQP